MTVADFELGDSQLLYSMTDGVQCDGGDGCIPGQLHQPRFSATVPCCSPYQAASTGLHNTNPLVDVRSVFQGLRDFICLYDRLDNLRIIWLLTQGIWGAGDLWID